MAEFQWWLLIVGLVAGGGLVYVVTMDGRRREQDIEELERRAEATWIADRLAPRDAARDAHAVENVLRLHREYLGLPPPDRLIVEDGLDGDPDRAADEVGHDGRRGADEDLPAARVQQAAAGQQAHAGADREQRGD
jgi:hypothetical protein